MVKHFIILVTFTLSSVYVFSQDIILKKDGSEISAKVLEFTEQHVKYKNFDFQDGPIRNINISDVVMITYENGREEVFGKPLPLSEINYAGSLEDLKNQFEDIGVNDIKMLRFFKKNNFTKYAQEFESACRRAYAGRTILGTGVCLVACGIVCTVPTANEQLEITGFISIGIGVSCLIATIPVSGGAGIQKRRIKDRFEDEYFGNGISTYQPKLNFGTTSHGIGLTLSF